MTWRERLQQPITDETCDLAQHWETCAVGEHHALHPEVVVYVSYGLFRQPLDFSLTFLGNEFWRNVTDGKAPAAQATLDAIEDRVLQLKRGTA